jgi:hypothetical protein
VFEMRDGAVTAAVRDDDDVVLRGGQAIAAFLREFFGDPSITDKQAYYMIATGAIPGGKVGGMVCTTPGAIRGRVRRVVGD